MKIMTNKDPIITMFVALVGLMIVGLALLAYVETHTNYDLNRDGAVNLVDVSILLSHIDED